MSEQTFEITIKDKPQGGKEIMLEKCVLTNFPRPDGSAQWIDSWGREWIHKERA